MKLYEEIILLQHMNKLGLFKGKYCIENVIAYYEPLIVPQEINLHYFWANFYIRPLQQTTRNHFADKDTLEAFKGFNLDQYSGIDKMKTLKNCVEPETGLHIFNEAYKSNIQTLF